MHKCEYKDRLEIIDGKLTRIVHAAFNGKLYQNEMDVVMCNEDNKWFCRNVVINNYMHTYGVVFADEDYYGFPMGLEEWGESNPIPFYAENKTSATDLALVKKNYPKLETSSFKYNDRLVQAVYFFKKDNVFFNFLVRRGMERLAFSEKVYTLSEEKKNEIRNFVTEFSADFSFCNLVKINQLMRYKKLLPDYTIAELSNYIDKTDNFIERMYILEQLDCFKGLTEERKNEFKAFLKKHEIKQLDSTVRKETALLKRYPNFSFEYIYFGLKFYKTEKIFIENYESGLKYILRKYDVKNESEMKAIFSIFEKPENRNELECLLSLNLSEIALNQFFYRLDENEKKAVRQFIRKNLTVCQKVNPSHQAIITVMKAGLYEGEQMDIYLKIADETYSHNLNKKVITYLAKNNIRYATYNHYLDMVSNLGHDKTDEYWAYPKNFEERNNELIEQKAQKEIAENKESEEKYRAVVENFIKKNPKVKIDGFEIYIPNSVGDISIQADVLNQCLISCDYVSKVIKDDSLLVFLRIDGNPIATCEISKSTKTIKQFYGDEKDRNNCLATEEQKAAMKKWLTKAVITREEFEMLEVA